MATLRRDVDLGQCPRRGCPGRLHPEVSADGSAWERDVCDGCGAGWFHDPPSTPPSPGEPWEPNADAAHG